MSVGFYATLAGENADAARSWQGATRSWQQHSAQLEDALHDEQDKNWRLQHQLNEAHQLNASWQAHAKQLEEKVRNWQQSALEYEAMNRAKSAVVEDKFGKGIAELAEIDSATAEKYFEEKKQELIQEWGINPWKTDNS
jgi:chromosome segregation ATPase